MIAVCVVLCIQIQKLLVPVIWYTSTWQISCWVQTNLLMIWSLFAIAKILIKRTSIAVPVAHERSVLWVARCLIYDYVLHFSYSLSCDFVLILIDHVIKRFHCSWLSNPKSLLMRLWNSKSFSTSKSGMSPSILILMGPSLHIWNHQW